ncbi:cytochrome c oxidase assembly protein [Afipia sp. P52-10]|uniref:cytochrome c oxidase assembly protein n=1 Tax=Afipia sp. P52-10 TaxID=1429916 RepID=UPI001FCB7546|nr:cytochrome c oxidase assembly protein [Afipia sp. P52-10]
MWLVLCGSAVWAHGEAGPAAGLRWTFDPFVVVPLAAALAVYVAGTLRLARAGSGRAVRPLQCLCYLTGWLALALALTSPLHWLGERMLAFHMIEHEIVMACAAPLLVVARPAAALLWGVPQRLRGSLAGVLRRPALRSGWRWLARPGLATVLHAVVIWIWHVPLLFDAAVANVAIHRLQHVSFLGAALLFWWAITRSRDRGLAAVHLFVTMLHTSALGALMALAPRVLYRIEPASAAVWGLTPLEDQQLAGLMMWIPACTVYAAAALLLAMRWVAQSGRAAERSYVRP